jgi:hypothetical protein
MAAANVELTSATIGSVSTATALPDVFGTVAASSQGSLVISFPAAAGTSGSPSVPAISGTYNGGSFTTSGRITLP